MNTSIIAILARACSACLTFPTVLHHSLPNQLRYVEDRQSNDGLYDNDLNNQVTKTGVVVGADTINYTVACPEHSRRDAIGNLTSDVAESIGTIDWFVNGKIRAINRSITPTQSQPNLKFAYGPDGQRIRKAVTWSTGGDTTWYVRDAQGNTMATYLQRNDSVFAQEHYMYGSSRLGSSAQWTYVSSLTPHTDTNRFARVLGKKNYELTNHLPRETAQWAPRSGFHRGEGNVLTTITDQKIAMQDGTTGTIAHWTADVVSYSDYFPFGMEMGERSGREGVYRFGFQAQETDDEVYGEGNAVAIRIGPLSHKQKRLLITASFFIFAPKSKRACPTARK